MPAPKTAKKVRVLVTDSITKCRHGYLSKDAHKGDTKLMPTQDAAGQLSERQVAQAITMTRPSIAAALGIKVTVLVFQRMPVAY